MKFSHALYLFKNYTKSSSEQRCQNMSFLFNMQLDFVLSLLRFANYSKNAGWKLALYDKHKYSFDN